MTTYESTDALEPDLRDAIVDLTPKQFDQLVLFLLNELDEEASVEFVPDTDHADLDFTVSRDHPIVPITYGIKLSQIPVDDVVPVEIVRSVAASVEEADYAAGAVMTTGTFSEPARESADRLGVELVDGDGLAGLLIDEQLGFREAGDRLTLDEEFWDLFRGQTRTHTIPTLEVPQADSIERLTQTLSAVAAGNHHKEDIAQKVEQLSGDSFDPRQADYYGTAGWLLGFLHKERETAGATGRGRWGITRLGKTYLSLRERGDDDAATELLRGQIRSIEIFRRILQAVRDAGTMRREDVADLVDKETELGGSTVRRRTTTLVKWLAELPEIEVSGRGPSQEIGYLASADTAASEPPHSTPAEATASAAGEPEGAAGAPIDENQVMDEILSSFETVPDTE